jgi:hypothetical protein
VADSLRVPPNPGVYFFLAAGRRTGAIVVNPPARESQLEQMSAAELRQVFPSATVIDDGEARQISEAAFSVASTRSLLPAFLIAILVALLGEALLTAGRKEG